MHICTDIVLLLCMSTNCLMGHVRSNWCQFVLCSRWAEKFGGFIAALSRVGEMMQLIRLLSKMEVNVLILTNNKPICHSTLLCLYLLTEQNISLDFHFHFHLGHFSFQFKIIISNTYLQFKVRAILLKYFQICFWLFYLWWVNAETDWDLFLQVIAFLFINDSATQYHTMILVYNYRPLLWYNAYIFLCP